MSFKEQLTIGKFTIWPCQYGGLWMEIEGGEGMQVTNVSLTALETLLEQFWKEHF